MHFKTLITPLAISLASASPLIDAGLASSCPAVSVQGLFYVAASNSTYQINCGLEYFTPTNLASQSVSDMFACADFCDSWNTGGNSPPCLAGSLDKTSHVCFLKGQLINSQTDSNVVTMQKTNV